MGLAVCGTMFRIGGRWARKLVLILHGVTIRLCLNGTGAIFSGGGGRFMIGGGPCGYLGALVGESKATEGGGSCELNRNRGKRGGGSCRNGGRAAVSGNGVGRIMSMRRAGAGLLFWVMFNRGGGPDRPCKTAGGGKCILGGGIFLGLGFI